MIRRQTNLALRVRGAGGFSIDHANAHWRPAEVKVPSRAR